MIKQSYSDEAYSKRLLLKHIYKNVHTTLLIQTGVIISHIR